MVPRLDNLTCELEKEKKTFNVKKTSKPLVLENKPAAQAAGADHSRCNSTNRQNLTLH